MKVEYDFPQKLGPLFSPAPYKIIWGGRDGMKSWGMARALLIMGAQHKIRWLCARETQQSIAESVHQLLEEQITAMGLSGCYRVEKSRIIGTIEHGKGMYGQPLEKPGFTEFVFAGLKHNVNQIKSFEALDGVWIEEANNVSKNSWDVVLPTIRKEGSEVWVSFNPELDTDDTYTRWVLNPPPSAVVIRTSYLDNEWLTESSRIKIDHLRRTDPVGFRNIYDGETRSSVEGAIYGDEIQAAMDSGRICSVPRDRSKPVHTFWDLGHGDLNAIWFVQMVDGWYRLIDYQEDNQHTLEWWMIQLQSKGYVYGNHWLPHDGVDAMTHKNLVSATDKSPEMILREAGFTVRLAPKLLVSTRINAGRTIFPQCQFDKNACSEGLSALRRYQWGAVNKNGVTRSEPLHNSASHGADAFQTFAVCAKQPQLKQEKKPAPPPRLAREVAAWT